MTTLMAMIMACALQFEDMGAQSDIEQLAQRIRQTLEEVDGALLDAAEADAITDEVARARRLHLDAIRDIEKLIEQLEYQFSNPPPNSSGGGGGQSSQQPQQQPSRPQQSDGSRSRGEQTPDQQPHQQGEGDPQDEQQGEQQSEGEQPTDGDPRGASPDNRQQEGGPPPPDEVLPYTRDDTDGRWGLLPPKVQEQLNNLHVDDVPDRYRGWLDAYIKAMRKLEQR